MENISKHLTYNEAVFSETAKRKGIANTPTVDQIVRLKLLAIKIFEPVREHFKVPIYVSSMFRSLALNKAIGGAKNSQHMANNGAAMDIDADKYGNVTNAEIFKYIKDNLIFDQLIWEMGDSTNPAWVHVSYKSTDNRGQILVAYKDSFNRTKYKAYQDGTA